ncbi:MAG: alkaline phosphatase [Maribacter sp.]|nr:alkaline phosphatase [Maribacter sp.]MBT8315039.1 alkaline phosphatase [Maribacter sp.]NNK18946.1 alkaline phosphatase [Maribacter sp.]
MENWKKTSLYTAVILLVLLLIVIYVFKISVSIPSSDIEFSPGQVTSKVNAEFKDEKPKNIIVFIVDGMGFGHLSLALQTQQTENRPSVWQEFDVKGWHDARSAFGPLTDSEASATAITTGTSTQFGHIGLDKNQNPLKNIFELASDLQFCTGIVTDSYIWDGTPAAFVAHTRNEDNARDILTQIASSELDLIFGELEDLGEDDIPEKAETIEILSKRFLLLDRSLKLPGNNSISNPIAALFDEDEIQDSNSSPNLTQLTEVALKYLSSQDKPFVLLVESEEMDAASHDNDSKRVLNGLQSIQETLSLVLDFSEMYGETLVVFTADHETGGLAAVADFDHYPNMQIRWSTKAHTAAVVPLFAKGPGAHYFADVHRNWEIGYLLKKLISQDIPNGKNE